MTYSVQVKILWCHYQVVSLGQLSFDCRTYRGRSRGMQGIH